jgi:predicted nuclease of predicted toxin-antitoxin system
VLATLLLRSGHDSAHVCSYGLGAAPDSTVLEQARAEQRVLISADTDFGTLLAQQHATGPSVILLRHGNGRRAEQIAALLQSNLDSIEDDLSAGAIAVFTDRAIRIRKLPIL